MRVCPFCHIRITNRFHLTLPERRHRVNALQWYRLGGEVSERQWSDIAGILAVADLNRDQPV
jgi:hypothetical protein